MTGAAFLISDLFDTFGRMANQAQRGAAANLMGLGDGVFPIQMAYHQNMLFRGRINNPDENAERQAQQQQQNNNNVEENHHHAHGPRINQEFIDRMEYVGARQPPESYQPQTISENDAGTVPCCVVCLSHARDTVVEPCGHFVLCWPCAIALAQHEDERGHRYFVECPVCRARARGFSFVMMS